MRLLEAFTFDKHVNYINFLPGNDVSNAVLVRIDEPENLVSKNFAEDTSTVSPPILCSKSCESRWYINYFLYSSPWFYFSYFMHYFLFVNRLSSFYLLFFKFLNYSHFFKRLKKIEVS